jgi:hypothetical protein
MIQGIFMGWFKTKQERLDEKLWSACYTGKLAKVEQLFAEGATMNYRSYQGQSPLLVAIGERRTEIAKLLLAKGADIHAADNDGDTALMKACYRGEKDLALLLIQQGCDIAAKNSDNMTALHWAAQQYSTDYEPVVHMLLEKGACIEARTNEGRTALHNAAASGRFNMVTILLAKGADPDAMDNKGNKPADLALANGQHGTANFLRTVYAPAAAAVKDGWQRTAMDEIAFTSEKTGTDYCLTEIFNFNSRIYNRIARNLKTNAESQTIRFFDEFTDKTILENAYQMLIKQGGKADSAAIHSTVLNKKSFN